MVVKEGSNEKMQRKKKEKTPGIPSTLFNRGGKLFAHTVEE
jgi:hypothetical protein